MAKSKVIITCAVTGSIHTPSMSPHLPVSAQEITQAALSAAEAGAAIVHLHARDPKDGRPTQAPDAFREFVGEIRRRSEVVINLATAAAQGGNVRVGLEDSLWDGPGRLAQSNADQVRRVRSLLEGLGLSVASADEARALLRLKGRDQAGF